MGLDILALAISLAAGVLGTLIRLLRDDDRFNQIFKVIEQNETLVGFLKIFGIQLPQPKEPYQERVNALFSKLQEVSRESDEIVSELDRRLRSKEEVVRQLESREIELSTKLDEARKSPEYYAARNHELLEELAQLQYELREQQAKEGRRSAWRDFVLFALGVSFPYLLSWIATIMGISLPVTP